MEVEGLVVFGTCMCWVDALVSGMRIERVLAVAHRVRSRYHHNGLVSREPPDLGRLYEIALSLGIVLRGG